MLYSAANRDGAGYKAGQAEQYVAALERAGQVRGDRDELLAAVGQAEGADKLPAAMEERKPFLGAQPPVGKQALKLAEFKNDCILYVPSGYDPSVAYGVVIYLPTQLGGWDATHHRRVQQPAEPEGLPGQ